MARAACSCTQETPLPISLRSLLLPTPYIHHFLFAAIVCDARVTWKRDFVVDVIIMVAATATTVVSQGARRGDELEVVAQKEHLE